MAGNFEEELLDDSAIDIRAIEVQPFRFEPMPWSSNDSDRSSEWETESEEENEDINLERIGNTDW